MAIKNYTSEIGVERIFIQLQQTLGRHGAKRISFDYGDDGAVASLSFVISVEGHFIPVQLPARITQAQAVLKQQYESGAIAHKRGKEQTYGWEQAYRVAWRNILDGVEAQMALREIGMAKMEEVFLPSMVTASGETFFAATQRPHFRLGSGDSAAEGMVIRAGCLRRGSGILDRKIPPSAHSLVKGTTIAAVSQGRCASSCLP